MKNKLYKPLGRLVLLFTIAGLSQTTWRNTAINPVLGSCTTFSVSSGNNVLFGNNEDYYNPETYLWTEPATEENLGCLYLGFDRDSHQGGINEKGLCFDANALPNSRINLHPELEIPPRHEPSDQNTIIWAPVLVLRKAATVEEAIEEIGKYQRQNWFPTSGGINYQLNFADAKGDAVVVSVDENGELAFTKKEKSKNYLISTNYNRANIKNAIEYPCKRYTKVEDMLSAINNEDDISPDYFKRILDSVHQESTVYSNIFDLKNGTLYLYNLHQFEEVVTINVEDQLTKGKINISIKELFSGEIAEKNSGEYFEIVLLLGIVVTAMMTFITIHFIKKASQRW